ncbi:Alpha-L-arabinofuranosidase C-terminus [Rhizoctonia solani]|uniref:non-reducing end alpha-L-arabinofuranosidase n=1 Tax=Rhizoctonia solani TaxID=456999 RepID=A0A8H7M3K4_9AGAM|nr:Alpha-L-arabinofuranosidase C-terminus [Rhizoctonia solani]
MTLASKVLFAALAAGALAQSALKIQVTKDTTHAIPSTLYGYMWEDINHSGDGGLYGELLQNRAFQAVSPHTSEALTAWSAYRGATIDVTNNTPGVSTALPNSLQVAVPTGVTGSVGFQNSGYWGKLWIKVQSGWKYTGSLYAKSDSYTGSVTVSLVSESAPNNNNFFRVTVDGSSAAGKNVYFGLLSLFPPTYRNRPNGMRVDLAEALAATKPGVWRFPGGNNLEGHAIDRRWKWNETIGPIENRPGRFADWGYPNTDGLGLMEYLNWAEDLGAEPILGVWAGLSIGDYADLSTFPVVPEAEIQPYVQEVINEIHFHHCYVKYRWRAFVTGLKAAFPDSGFEYLATSLPDTALDPAYTYLDFHQYNTPEWFIERALQYDTYPRNGTHLFIGEYAVTSTNSSCLLGEFSCGRLEYPTLQGAVAEAAYMTGLERNSDVIFASAYAPSLQHINGWQWTPDIITFDAGDIVKSASYYAQHMFSTNLGTHVIKTSPAPSADVPLHWVASHDIKNKIVYLKAANTANSSFIASFAFGFPLAGRSSSITVLSAPMANVSNTLTTTNAVLPKTTSLKVASGSTVLNYTFPAYSVAVFKLPVNW